MTMTAISFCPKDRLFVLDGLRFFAAFFVLLAHYVLWVVL